MIGVYRPDCAVQNQALQRLRGPEPHRRTCEMGLGALEQPTYPDVRHGDVSGQRRLNPPRRVQ